MHPFRAPPDWMAAFREQAQEDGFEFTEWLRQLAVNGLSKKRRKGLSSPPIQRGRPKKPPGETPPA